MTPSVLLALANVSCRRRSEEGRRLPFANEATARDSLAEEGLTVGRMSAAEVASLRRLADAVSSVAGSVADHRPPPPAAVGVINELAAASRATVQLGMAEVGLRAATAWQDPTPVARLARQVVEELGALDPSRLRRCQRKQCGLLFFDETRSNTRRWHAENPCGWLERQHRRRSQLAR